MILPSALFVVIQQDQGCCHNQQQTACGIQVSTGSAGFRQYIGCEMVFCLDISDGFKGNPEGIIRSLDNFITFTAAGILVIAEAEPEFCIFRTV